MVAQFQTILLAEQNMLMILCILKRNLGKAKRSVQSVNIPFHLSKLMITPIKLDKDRFTALNRRGKKDKEKGKAKKDVEKRLD